MSKGPPRELRRGKYLGEVVTKRQYDNVDMLKDFERLGVRIESQHHRRKMLRKSKRKFTT
jgi:hypothetical protein